MVNTSDGEKILSPLQYLLNSAKFGPVVSTDDSIIRGIPVNQWETCLYSTKSMATLRVTIAFSGKCFLLLVFLLFIFHIQL